MKFKILLLVAFIAVSCGKLSDKAKDAVDSISTKANGESGSVIAYNNALVDYMNVISDEIQESSQDYEEMYIMVIKKKNKKHYTGGDAFKGFLPYVNTKKEGVFLLKPDNNLPADVREVVVNKVKATVESFENTKDAYEKFHLYLDNEDYKDDNWTKGEEYIERIKNNIISFYDNRAEAYKILKPLTNAAELELLKNHPLSESLIASKTDLALAEEIVDILYAKNIDMDALNAKYTELENNVKKHKNLTPNLLKTHKKEPSYNSFYEQIEKFLGEIRKSKRDNEITEFEIKTIRNTYGYLVDDYNKFV